MTLGRAVEQTITTQRPAHQSGSSFRWSRALQAAQGQLQLIPMGDDVQVSLEMEFVFANQLLSMAFGKLFQQIAGQLVDAFTKRANELYGR